MGPGEKKVSMPSARSRRVRALVLACAMASTMALASVQAAEAGWSPGSDMIFSRRGHTATLLADGRVLVAGGDGRDASGSYNYLASAEIYDPATDAWTEIAPMEIVRTHHTATLLPDGRVLVVGGGSPSGESAYTTEIYDPAADSWTTIASSYRNGGHTATGLPDGSVLIAGGCCGDTGPDNSYFMFAVDVFDPATGAWTPLGPMQRPHAFHTATLLGDGRVLITGGWGGSRQYTPPLDGAEVYDPLTGTSSFTRSNLEGMSAGTTGQHHQTSPLPDGSALVTGGCCIAAPEVYCVRGCETLVGPTPSFRYDPPTNAFIPVAQPSPRFRHASVALSDGRVLIAGGRTRIEHTYDQTLSSSEIYDPASGLWTPGPPLSSPRNSPAAVVLNDGRVMLIGGLPDDSADMLRSVDIFDPGS